MYPEGDSILAYFARPDSTSFDSIGQTSLLVMKTKLDLNILLHLRL